jgi:hypothetical protein
MGEEMHVKHDDYEWSKIDNMKRIGLIGPKGVGYGSNGGAAPDWVIERQKAQVKYERAKGWWRSAAKGH